MTVPVAEEALVPLRVAASLTAVPVGTLILVPLCPPPDSEVDNEVGWGVEVGGADPSPAGVPLSVAFAAT